MTNVSSAIALGILVVLLLPVVVGAVAVVITIVNRSDPDATARRPAAVYAYATCFITVFVTLFATFAVVQSLCSLIGSHGRRGSSGSSSGPLFGSDTGVPGVLHPVGDAAARGVTLGLLFALVAGAAFVLHLRIGRRATDGIAAGEAAGRVRSSYVAAVSFFCVLITIFATVATLYQVFRLIGPGVFSPGSGGERTPALRTLIPLAYLAVASALLLRFHLRHAPDAIRSVVRWRAPRVTATPPAAMPPPPPSYV